MESVRKIVTPVLFVAFALILGIGEITNLQYFAKEWTWGLAPSSILLLGAMYMFVKYKKEFLNKWRRVAFGGLVGVIGFSTASDIVSNNLESAMHQLHGLASAVFILGVYLMLEFESIWAEIAKYGLVAGLVINEYSILYLQVTEPEYPNIALASIGAGLIWLFATILFGSHK